MVGDGTYNYSMENNHGAAGLGNPDPRTREPRATSGTFGRIEWPHNRENPSTRRERQLSPVNEDIFASDMWEIFDDAGALLLKKHHDYGPHNIGASPGGPLNGLRVRMWDKLARINNLIDSGATPQNESLRDSFLDLLNYSAIALMVLDGKWPKE